MAKTYKILVNDGKGTDNKPVSVVQGASAKGEPVRMTAKRGWRFELQDDLKGKNLGPDQVRLKRMGKNLGLMFDGSVNPDVIIEDFYAENEDKEKDNGSPMIVGQAEDGGIYEYVPQDPAASSMASQLKDGNTPVIVALGGGPLAADFALAGLPLIAAAGGGIGGLLAGGAAVVAAAAAGGGGGGGGDTPVVVPATVAPTVAIDTDVNNDGYVNKAEVGGKTTYSAKTALPTTAVAGDTITVTDGTTTKTHVLTAADITNTFVTDTFTLPTEGSTITVTAKMTSAATGVSSANATDTAKLDTSAFIDPVTPEPFNPVDPLKTGLRVTINSDVNNDGILSSSDLTTTDVVKATIALTKDAAVGDVLTVKITNNGSTTTRTITLTDVDIAAKQVVLTGLAAPANGNTIKVEATIQDVALNASPSTASDTAVVNTAIPGVTILNDENNDGFINKMESDKSTMVSVKVEVPASAVAGNTIVVTDGKTTISHTVLATDITNKSFTLSDAFAKPAEGTEISVSATMGSNVGTDKAKLDTSAFIDPINPDPIQPADPTKSGLRVTINSDENNDGFLSNSDLSTADLVKATIALTTDAAVGDVLTVVITGNATQTITLTAAQIAAKQVVLKGLTVPTDGNTITVEATIQDVAGNTSPATASDTATVNTATPGVMITTDANNDGLINKAELDNVTTPPNPPKVSVQVEVPKFALAGDTVNVTDGTTTVPHVLTAAQVTAKKFTLMNAFAAPADGGTITVSATFGTTTGTDSAKLDTVSSNVDAGLAVQISTDSNNDGFVNINELGTLSTFTSHATFDKTKVSMGDSIVFTANNGSGADMVVRHVLTAADMQTNDAGKGFVNVTFAKPNNAEIQTVTVNFVDAAGNAATDAKPTDKAKLHTVPPTNDGVDLGVRIITDIGQDAVSVNGADMVGDKFVSAAELTAQADANNFISRATFDETKVAVGDKIIFKAINGTTELTQQTVTLTQTDITNKFVEVRFAKPSQGQLQKVTATYVDAAGNISEDDSPFDDATLDSAAPNDGLKPTVEITTDNGTGGAVLNAGKNDGFVNNLEIGSDPDHSINGTDARNYSVDASFDRTKVALGDKVVFTVGSTVKEVTVTQAILDAGKATTTFTAPTANGATFTVTAVIKDALGNTTTLGTGGSDSATRNFLEAKDDSTSVSASGSTNTVLKEGNVITGATGGAGKDIDTQFSGTDVFVTGIKKGTGTTTAFDPLTGTGSNGGVVVGEFGTLTIGLDGAFEYVLSASPEVRALIKDQKVNDVFTYQVKDTAGNISTAKLTVEVVGVNDVATITLKSDPNGTSLFRIDSAALSPVPFGSDAKPAIAIKDDDAGQGAFIGVSKADASTLSLEYGDLTFNPVTSSSTSVSYNMTYKRTVTNGGTNDLSDTIRHDLFTVHSADGVKSETLDFAILDSGTEGDATKQEFHVSDTTGLKINSATSTTKDTLVLEGSQLSFDFMGTAATSDIKHIEVIDITGTGNNTIKLDLNSLTQADLSGSIHKLFIKGNNGDVVRFDLDTSPTAIAHAANAVTVDGTDYWVYQIGTNNDELLVQTTINNITVNG